MLDRLAASMDESGRMTLRGTIGRMSDLCSLGGEWSGWVSLFQVMSSESSVGWALGTHALVQPHPDPALHVSAFVWRSAGGLHVALTQNDIAEVSGIWPLTAGASGMETVGIDGLHYATPAAPAT